MSPARSRRSVPLIRNGEEECPVLEVDVELVLRNKAVDLAVAADSWQTWGREVSPGKRMRKDNPPVNDSDKCEYSSERNIEVDEDVGGQEAGDVEGQAGIELGEDLLWGSQESG